jgi:peptidyl-prolyl cis-trans isomerase D
MLQKIRDKITGWFAIVFLAAIAIVFIFWGIQFESTANQAAAKVNGEEVPLALVRNAWQERQAELQQALRDELPEELARQEQSRLVDGFIDRQLLVQRATERKYRVSDAELARTLREIPALQVDGEFSRDRYAALLRAQGRTEAEFEEQFRRDLEAGQLRGAIAVSSFTTPSELRRRAELEGERRTVEYLLLPSERYLAAAPVSDADVQAAYARDKARYMTQESAVVQYLELRLADVAAEIEITEEGLRAHYAEVAADRYSSPERRRASHILVESGADDATARGEAEALLKRIQGGEDFAALARSESDDPGSKEQGGDLGWATRESLVPAFAEALFGMQQGEVKGPIKTQFGYHIIRLDGVEASGQRPFEEVRAELEESYRTEQAQATFYERSQELADEAFAALTELDSVATKSGLALKRVGGFTRQGSPEIGNSRQLIDAVFSEEVLRDGQNSPPVEIDDDRVVVLRVLEHKPASERPLVDVRAEVEAGLRRAAAGKAAQASAAEVATAAKAGRSLAELAAGLGLGAAPEREIGRGEMDVPPELLRALYATTATGPASAGSVALGSGDAAVYLVKAIAKGATDPSALAAASQPMVMQLAAAEFAAYTNEIKRTAKIVRNPKVFE